MAVQIRQAIVDFTSSWLSSTSRDTRLILGKCIHVEPLPSNPSTSYCDVGKAATANAERTVAMELR
jgi:hypothetical protein